MRLLYDLRATVVRHSQEHRATVVGDKCLEFHCANIARVSREYRATAVQHLCELVAKSSSSSPMIRAIIVRHLCDCRKYGLITHSV